MSRRFVKRRNRFLAVQRLTKVVFKLDFSEIIAKRKRRVKTTSRMMMT